nr:DUF1573 domain-containing protein [uncultured Bacteroides sp.]
MKYINLCWALILLLSCQYSAENKIGNVLKDWMYKEILFPEEFISDSLAETDFTIVSYVDSVGCLSCKLNLRKWEELMSELSNIADIKVGCLFFLQTTDTERIEYLLQWDMFTYPLYFDDKNSFNQLNHFPKDDKFHTFLLDENNKVVAIGNPVHNPKIKELYLNIIQGKKDVEGGETLRTEINIEEPLISLGRFNWKEERKATFKIENIGKHPLVINDVTTSCGCTSVDYSKEPVRPGDSISLQVTYKADYPEHFDKTITVYCNANPSLVHLKIMGDAE